MTDPVVAGARARTFHEPVEIHIGNQTRALVLTPDAYRRATRALGGTDPREALTRGALPLDAVCIIAACARHHEDKRVSDRTVEKWIEHEPKKTTELVEAVGECVRRFLVATGVVEEETPGNV